MYITDKGEYERIYDELGLDGAFVDDIEEDVELTVAFDMEVGADIAVFQCPFQSCSDCEYTITDFVASDGDIVLVRSAAAAHLVVEHGTLF